MKAILACDPVGGIGFQGSLPWQSLSGDLARFKELTAKSALVMGRGTWDSLPRKPLPGRNNIVISKSQLALPSGATQYSSFEEVPDLNAAWFIGGAGLLASAWPYINEFHLSMTFKISTCDTFIDLLYLKNNFIKVQSVDCTDHFYEIWKR